MLWKFASRLAIPSQGIEPSDLMQEGSIAILAAIKRFDISAGYRFSSFACRRVAGAMKDYLRERAGVIKIPRTARDRAAR